MVKLTALWLKTDNEGNKYMSGNLGDATISVRKNKYKVSENQPDYIIYVEEYQKQQKGTPKERKEDIPL